MSHYIEFYKIKDVAYELGFDDCGASKVEEIDITFFKGWLDKGYNADMKYMGSYIDKRQNPALLMENAKSMISFIVSYNIDNKQNSNYKIASYALVNDYHKAIKSKLFELIKKITFLYPDFQAIAYVDTAPLFDKIWAKKAGLGAIGKNSCLINSKYGSKILIGEIICNYITDYKEDSEEDICKKCSRCIDNCPNNAINEGKTIDSNKCISYQTIENKGDIDNSLDTKGYIFGCDICQDICPWNKGKAIKESRIFKVNNDIINLQKSISQNTIDKSIFNKAKKNSSIDRIKFEKLISNINHIKEQN